MNLFEDNKITDFISLQYCLGQEEIYEKSVYQIRKKEAFLTEFVFILIGAFMESLSINNFGY